MQSQPPRTLSYARPTQIDNRHKAQKQGPAEVPNVFYEPMLRKPIERIPTPPQRSAAHRRLPSDNEHPRPDFMGDTDMEDAVLGSSSPQRKASQPEASRKTLDHRRRPSFNPSSSSQSRFSTRERPHPTTQAASQMAPAPSSSRPLLSAQSRSSSSKHVAFQPTIIKADVDRHLMARRLQAEIDRAGNASLSKQSTSSSASAQPPLLSTSTRSFLFPTTDPFIQNVSIVQEK